jgi:hypothetical protein
MVTIKGIAVQLTEGQMPKVAEPAATLESGVLLYASTWGLRMSTASPASVYHPLALAM